jgi:methionyl-tRNA formyltransferase
VIHASDLPLGRGWSPHIWQLIGGAELLTLTLLEVANKVDSGDIWKKIKLQISRDALWDQINEVVFDAELQLISFAVEKFDEIEPQAQSTIVDPTYYSKRKPVDSMIDPRKSIEEQFDLIRVCDPDRFPAYFELRGFKYNIRVEKA